VLPVCRTAASGEPDRVTQAKRPLPTPVLAMTISQACDSLSISYETWRREVEPEIRLVRIGSRKLVPRVELDRWLEAHAVAADDALK